MIENAKTGLRVLIVEDEALVRLVLADMLTNLGHQVAAEAHKVENANRLAAEADYEIALLDLNLGSGASYATADIVRKRGKPVIFVTGYCAEGLADGYWDCRLLSKPFSQAQVGESIAAALAGTPLR